MAVITCGTHTRTHIHAYILSAGKATAKQLISSSSLTCVFVQKISKLM